MLIAVVCNSPADNVRGKKPRYLQHSLSNVRPPNPGKNKSHKNHKKGIIYNSTYQKKLKRRKQDPPRTSLQHRPFYQSIPPPPLFPPCSSAQTSQRILERETHIENSHPLSLHITFPSLSLSKTTVDYQFTIYMYNS